MTVYFISPLLQIGTDVEAFAKNGKDEKFTQPFLLSLGPEGGTPTEFFLICDHTSIPAGDSVVAAFDLLFKAHYTFNVEVAGCLHTFFNFFDAVFYGMQTYTLNAHLRTFCAIFRSSPKASITE